jgi:hypothetical protein
MTKQQLDEVAAWRSSPLTSKTMWTIYVGQGSLGLLAWQIVALGSTPTSVLLALIAAIAALAITGVAGLAWTDPAVTAARILGGQPSAGAEYVGKRPSAPPGAQ